MPLQIHKAEKPKIDLTTKNSLSAWLKNHAKELWNAFGSPPTFKDYDPNKIIDFIKNGIEKDDVSISPEKEKEVIDNIKSKGKNGRAAMQYVSNLYLRGAGLGLRDQKEELLRQLIREEIRKILKEGGLGSGKIANNNTDKEKEDTFLKSLPPTVQRHYARNRKELRDMMKTHGDKWQKNK